MTSSEYKIKDNIFIANGIYLTIWYLSSFAMHGPLQTQWLIALRKWWQLSDAGVGRLGQQRCLGAYASSQSIGNPPAHHCWQHSSAPPGAVIICSLILLVSIAHVDQLAVVLRLQTQVPVQGRPADQLQCYCPHHQLYG